MNEIVRKNFIIETIKGLQALNDVEFENFGNLILEDICGKKLSHRGMNTEGATVGYTVDSFNDDATIVGEYSVEDSYYTDKDLTKFNNDKEHALKLAPQVKHIYLLSNQECGPLAGQRISGICSTLGEEKNIELHSYDSRRIAEHIVDSMLCKDSPLEKLLEYLPVLRKIKNEYIMTNMLPAKDSHYLNRDEEYNIIRTVNENKCTFIYGISGIGKTQIAISVAQQLKNNFDIVLWVEGNDLKTNNLTAFYVSRYGFKQNLLGLINSYKTLIVIDGLENQIPEIINTLFEHCNEGSRILITSQIEIIDDKCKKIPISFLSKSKSLEILNQELNEKCPLVLLEKIINKIGGHPLLLSLINKMVYYDGSWKDIENDIEHFPKYEDTNGQIFCNRLLQKHIDAISNELAALKWLGSQFIEDTMLNKLIGVSGFKKLNKRSLLGITGTNGTKIHDIVFNSLKHITLEPIDFTEQFNGFLEEHARIKDIPFFRSIYIYRKKIMDFLRRSPTPGIILYAYLHSISPSELDYTLAESINYGTLLEETYSPDKYFKIVSIIELNELFYMNKKANQSEGLDECANHAIETINSMLNIRNIDIDLKHELKHHLGKFFIYNNRKEDAIECFREVIKYGKNTFQSKLQLARALRDINPQESIQYIREILSTYRENKEIISITTVLAAFEELSFDQYKDLRNEFLDSKDLFESALFYSSIESFDQPFKVLVRVGRIKLYTDPDWFINLVKKMPIPSEETIEDKFAFTAGELYKNMGKSIFWANKPEDESLPFFKQAGAYFSKVNTNKPYEIVKIAENHVWLKEITQALKLLNLIPEKDREKFWYYTYSQALRIKEDFNEAIIAIDKAISELKDNKYKDTFYYEKGRILKAKNDGSYINTLKTALECCTNDKFREQIQKEIEIN